MCSRSGLARRESKMTNEQRRRLRELEELEADGIRLTDAEAAELRELLSIENAGFVAEHDFDLPLHECDHLTERSLETGRF